MAIRLNQKNSKVVGSKVFITGMKAHSLNDKLKHYVITNSKVNHPELGILYEYIGEYTRNIKK
jgi:hypothetical protein